MSDVTQQIKEKLDIVDFIKQYIEVKPAGKNFKANCPFHREKTPSFMISPERQTWHCFGSCNEGGDIIKFLMKYENLEFYDALKILAEKAGVDIQRTSDRDFRSYNVLYSVLNAANDFFKSTLLASDKIKKYLKERGLTEKTISEFDLGLAPDEPDVMTRHLLKLGYGMADIEKAGLALKTERGTYWDRFRGRLIFPIHNHLGKVVGFGGRVLPGAREDSAKYVNSPESPIYQKSKILYGFYKTKNEVRELKQAVVVEGYMDFLMAWQDGIKNVVASSGTALTGEHLKTLRRLADEVVLSFDADDAGQAAAERSIDAAEAFDFTVKLLRIEGNFKDPADVAKERPGLMKEFIKNAKPAMEFYFHKYLSNPQAGLKEKKNNIRIVLTKIKNMPSAVERNSWIKELAKLTYLDEKTLLEEMESIKTVDLQKNTPEENEAEEVIVSRKELIIQRLLGIALNTDDQEIRKIMNENLEYLPDEYQKIYKGENKGGLDKIIDIISMRFSFENEEEKEPKLKKEFFSLIKELKQERLKSKQQEIKLLIARLEQLGDNEGIKEAMKQFDSISKEMHNF